jgi:hypothetical protein
LGDSSSDVCSSDLYKQTNINQIHVPLILKYACINICHLVDCKNGGL